MNKVADATSPQAYLPRICESPFSGEIEMDESYFGARRIRGKRGRGADGKTIVFGIYKRNGKVYTEVVPNCSRKPLYAIIKGKVDVAFCYPYRRVSDLRRHRRSGLSEALPWSNHSNNEFAVGTNHINGIEGFWGFAKIRLVKFRGMRKSTFYLHLKECEFRFNYRNQDLYKVYLPPARSAFSHLPMS